MLRLLITHQWSAGEVVHVQRIHLQFEVDTVSVLCAANKGECVNDRRCHCVPDSGSRLHSPHRQRISVWMSPA